MKIAHSLTYKLNDVQIARLTYTSVVPNPTFAPEMFALPEDIKGTARPPATGSVAYQPLLRQLFAGRNVEEESASAPGVGRLRLVELAPDVQQVVGGEQNSLIVAMKDGIVIFDAPVDEGQSRWVIHCAGPISTFFHIVLPNSLSPIFAVGILQFLFCWNALLIPLLFLRTTAPLPVVFAQIAGQFDPNWDLRAVAAIVTTIVPLIVFLVFQRQFAGGSLATSGSKE